MQQLLDYHSTTYERMKTDLKSQSALAERCHRITRCALASTFGGIA
jgi:hypothetical protein